LVELTVSIDILSVLFVVAIIAGIIDTLAGGGGLIVLPTLLIVQLPVLNALATNKLQGTFGTLTASITLWRKKAIRWTDIRTAFYASLVGSAVGTTVVHFIDASLLEWCIPVVLIIIACYFFIASNAGQKETDAMMSKRHYHYGIVPTIGAYDGVLGPGTGSFFSFANVAFMGKTLTQATVHAKFLNFASNIASLIIFIASGNIVWLIGAVMIVGQVIGALIGSRLILSKGQIVIRPLIIVTCLAMCIYFLMNKL